MYGGGFQQAAVAAPIAAQEFPKRSPQAPLHRPSVAPQVVQQGQHGVALGGSSASGASPLHHSSAPAGGTSAYWLPDRVRVSSAVPSGTDHGFAYPANLQEPSKTASGYNVGRGLSVRQAAGVARTTQGPPWTQSIPIQGLHTPGGSESSQTSPASKPAVSSTTAVLRTAPQGNATHGISSSNVAGVHEARSSAAPAVGAATATVSPPTTTLPLPTPAALVASSEVEELRRRVEELEQASRGTTHNPVAEAAELGQRLASCEDELSRERATSRRLDDECVKQADELQSYLCELKSANEQLRHCAAETAEADALRHRLDVAERALHEEELRSAELSAELEPGRHQCGAGNKGSVKCLAHDAMPSENTSAERRMDVACAVAVASGASASSEAQRLRADLARRDRELLAEKAARRRAVEQSERAAAALRAKLAELEAVVAATSSASSVSASSRASSPHRSEESCGRCGSPNQSHSCIDEGMQTEPDVLGVFQALSAETG